MKVSKAILEKLLNDMNFRLITALALGVTERTIMNYAHANSDNLTKHAAVLVYKNFGFKESDLFEKESQSHSA